MVCVVPNVIDWIQHNGTLVFYNNIIRFIIVTQIPRLIIKWYCPFQSMACSVPLLPTPRRSLSLSSCFTSTIDEQCVQNTSCTALPVYIKGTLLQTAKFASGIIDSACTESPAFTPSCSKISICIAVPESNIAQWLLSESGYN